MSDKGKIAVLYSQRPFVHDGTEQLAAALLEKCKEDGYRAQAITLPYAARTDNQWMDSWLLWRLADLRESNGETIDCVVALGTPASLVQHPNKVVWQGAPFALPLPPGIEDGKRLALDSACKKILRMELTALREARRVYVCSEQEAEQLKNQAGITAKVLPIGARPALDDHGTASAVAFLAGDVAQLLGDAAAARQARG